jgi:hypothetical protein
MSISRRWLPGVLLAPLLAIAPQALAATISLTAPLGPVQVADGEDYATDVLGDPWDFDKRRDFLFEERFGAVSVAGGNWAGTFRDQDAVIYPVFQDFPAALPTLNTDMPDFGKTRPIDAGKYKELSYRLRASVRSAFGISWTRNASFPVSCGQFGAGCNPEAGSVTNPDGYSLPGAFVPYSDWTLYDFDLSDRSPFLGSYGVDWAGQITGLALQPTAGPAGTTLEIDWMRLSDPATSPVVTLQWTTSGAPAGSTVNVVVDGTDSGSCGGEVLARQVPNTGTYALRTAKLPPGRYRVHVELVHTNGPGTALDVLASSGCTGVIQVAQAPTLRFTAPSPTSGEDYATAQVGNPWDMSDEADVANLNAPFAERYFNDPTFAGGVFSATAVAPGRSDVWSDVTLLMNGPASFPIDTRKYRYLTYRMSADTSHFAGIDDYVTHGGGLRPLFWDQTLAADGTDSRAALVYEDWHTYSIDLFDPNVPDADDTNVANLGWQGIPFVSTLHIDPLEVQISSGFAFDDVKLTAESCTAGPYTVAWDLAAAAGSLTLDLFADTDTSGADGTHLAGPLTVASGAGSAAVDLGGLTDGRYYIYGRVSDGLHTRVVYSRVPIVKPCGDFSLPALVPLAGSWTAVDGGFQVTPPAIALFDGVPGDRATLGAMSRVVAKKPQTVIVLAYKGASDYVWVQIDQRKGRVVAFRRARGRRKRLKSVSCDRRPKQTIPVTARVANGKAVIAVNGRTVLTLQGLDLSGSVGLGAAGRGTLELTAIHGAATP